MVKTVYNFMWNVKKQLFSLQDTNADYSTWIRKIFSYSNPIILILIVFKIKYFLWFGFPTKNSKNKTVANFSLLLCTFPIILCVVC